LTLGYEKVRALLVTDNAAIAISAHDASLRGREKLLGGNAVSFTGDTSQTASGGRIVVDLFGLEELSLALGRENVVHAALRVGGLADRFMAECRRLKDYRGWTFGWHKASRGDLLCRYGVIDGGFGPGSMAIW